MPVAPSKLEFFDVAEGDLATIKRNNPSDAERIYKKIEDWEEFIRWGRVPQEQLEYLTDSPPEYNFYRQWVGKSGHRVIYEISGDTMLVVAILPKGDHTYDMNDLINRMGAH